MNQKQDFIQSFLNGKTDKEFREYAKPAIMFLPEFCFTGEYLTALHDYVLQLFAIFKEEQAENEGKRYKSELSKAARSDRLTYY